MMKLIRGAEVYAPEKLGIQDVLMSHDKIVKVADSIDLPTNDGFEVEVIDGTGMILTPGFIDCHFHLLGGGGEGGFQNRTPEVNLTDLTTAGVTTVVGCLGTDGIGRDLVGLVAKAKGLEIEGISTYLYEGSYRLPIKTITDSIIKDMMLVDKFIGIGEVAIADHRSSQPTFEEFTRAAADARVGGMLSGKAGIINVHLGDGADKIDLITRTVAETEIPISQFLPTHANRNPELFAACLEFAKQGGTIDFTASEDPEFWAEQDGEVSFAKGLKQLLAEGIDLNNFTMSSDGQGSLPYFNEQHEFIGLGVGSAKALLVCIKDAFFNENIPLEIILRAVTSNPANILKLNHKGRIEAGLDADFCLLDSKSLAIQTVIAKGQTMIQNQEIIVRGTFER